MGNGQIYKNTFFDIFKSESGLEFSALRAEDRPFNAICVLDTWCGLDSLPE